MNETRAPRSSRFPLMRRLRAWSSNPNPLLVRELQHAARLTRTPLILSAVTCCVTLALASIGGLASIHQEPARVGVALFQTFFSLAFALVAWVGPAVAASTVAGERSAHTWELVVLTGMPPARIAQGKFLAALSYVYWYVVMLAPVATLTFLFGGVSVLELASAFALLCILAALWVAFGLSVSSKLASPVAAVIVTLITAIPLSFLCYFAIGVGGAHLAHERWNVIPDSLPIWLPTAYARVEFDASVLILLVACPLLLIAIPAWFFYEVTVANLSSITDDRSSGLRLWFVVSAPLLAGMLMLPGVYLDDPDPGTLAVGILLFECFLVVMAFVFAGEPLGPARRLLHRWRLRGVPRWRRFLGPSVVRAAITLIVVGSGCIGIQLGIAAWVTEHMASPHHRALWMYVTSACHAVALLVFTAGVATWLRSRHRSALAPRLILGAVLFFLVVGPWVLMAIAGWSPALDESRHRFVAALSPTYVVVMLNELHRGPGLPLDKAELVAGAASMATWLLAGIGFLPPAMRRSRRVLEEHAAKLDALEAAVESDKLDAGPIGGP